MDNRYFRIGQNLLNNIKMNFKRKYYFLFIILSIVTISVLIILNLPVSKNKLCKNIEEGLLKGSTFTISKYSRIDDNKVLPFELEPLIRYYKSNPKEITKLINELKNKGKSVNITLKSKNSLIGKEYYMNLDRVRAKFDFNVDEVEASLDNKKFKSGEVLVDLIPGLYNLQYKLATKFGDISKELPIDILTDMDKVITVDAANIVVYSNFLDARVFINNKDTGMTVENIKDIGLIPTDKNLKLHLEREFPWGSIKSNSVVISDELYYKIDINMINDKLSRNINDTINIFFDSTFDALNNRDKESIINATEEVKSKVYSYIEEKSLVFKNNYEISNVNVVIEKSDFKYEQGSYSGNILTRVNYNVYKKFLPFISEDYNQLFLIQIQYGKENWEIKSIENIDIDL